MIVISEFQNFLKEVFPLRSIYIDEFKPDLQFVEIDCFDKQPVKLAIEISPEAIKISTVSKRPSIDFSLYDYSFNNVIDAKKLILRIKETGKFSAE